jgi:hypothetical protein
MKKEKDQSRMDQGPKPGMERNTKQKEVQEWTLDLQPTDIFRIEFMSSEEKAKVIDGGP